MKRLVRRVYDALLTTAFAVLAAVRWPLRLRRAAYDPASVRRILVLRYHLLGDAVQLTPALRVLRDRFPHARIDVLASPVQVPILTPLPFVDRVLVWEAGDLAEARVAIHPEAWRTAACQIAQLRADRYDLAVSAYGRLNSAIALLCGAPHRVGFEDEALPGTLTHAIHGGRYDRAWHEIVYNAAVALSAAYPDKRLGDLPWGDVPNTQLVVEPEARTAADTLLGPTRGEGASDEKPIVVFQPGATNGDAKRWPVPHWAELARLLDSSGWRIVLVGARGDASLGQQVARQAGIPLLNLIGRTDTRTLLAVLDRASVVVAGDSGPTHCAVALGRPTVAIFGPTDPQISGPFDMRHAAVARYPLPCSPCYRLGRVAECPLGHTLCQWLVTPDEVRAAVDEVTARPVAEASPALQPA